MLSNGRSLLAVQYKPFHITLPDNFCNRVIKENESLDIIDGTVESKDKNRRSSKISWVPQDKFPKELQQCIDSANKLYNFSLHEFESLQYSRYEEGDHYDWHVDNHSKPYNNGMIRKLSFSICLNDEFEGGGLQIWNDKIDAKKGRIVIFPSFAAHRVLEFDKKDRYTMITFIKGNTFK